MAGLRDLLTQRGQRRPQRIDQRILLVMVEFRQVGQGWHVRIQQGVIDNRRQQLLYAIGRMNGAKAVAETLAKRRLFFSSLPGMADADKRDQDLLTSNAADLMPVEMPWRGTPRSPLFLLETPYRQLIPFSLFDPGLSDANMLVMAKSGGGKTFMVQQFLLIAARDNPLISIL